MKVSELILKLKSLDQDREIMILDGFNGGGTPRELNVGPNYRRVTEQNAEDSGDCEDLIGHTVVVLGYGSY